MKSRGFNISACVIFFLHGCIFAGNQLLVEQVSTALNATETQKGALIGAFYFGQMLLCLFFGELSERAGKRRSAAAAAIVAFFGTLMVALSASIPLTTVGFFLFGSGLGSFEAAMFALCADNNAGASNRLLNFTQGLFSIGAVLSPALLGLVLKNDEFRIPYIVIAALCAAAGIYFICSKKIDSFAVKTPVERGVAILSLMKNTAVLAYMAAIAVFIGAETALTYWVFDYFDTLSAKELAGYALSAYWCASILGRFAASRLRSAKRLVAPCFAVAALGFALLLLLPTPPLKFVGIIVASVGFAPLYAGISSLAGDLLPERSGSVYALMIFAVNAGGLLFQPIISSFAQFSDIRIAFAVALGICVIAAAAMWLFHHRRAAADQRDTRA